MAAPFKRMCLTQACILRCARSTQPQRPFSNTSHRPTDEYHPFNDEYRPFNDDTSLIDRPNTTYTTAAPDPEIRKTNVDDISTLAHRQLEQHRELREVARLAAWEMPLLSALAEPTKPLSTDHTLRWRYTTYMGEMHPAARKVVVEFRPESLFGDGESEQREARLLKLLKLVGPRYNPSTGLVKMSCESFETQAQNKRYLADIITKLIAECKDPDADTFEDVPLDLRHHKAKPRHQFPREWLMTPERRKMLEEKRKTAMLEEGRRVEQDRMVVGVRAIEEDRKIQMQRAEKAQAEARRPRW